MRQVYGRRWGSWIHPKVFSIPSKTLSLVSKVSGLHELQYIEATLYKAVLST